MRQNTEYVAAAVEAGPTERRLCFAEEASSLTPEQAQNEGPHVREVEAAPVPAEAPRRAAESSDQSSTA